MAKIELASGPAGADMWSLAGTDLIVSIVALLGIYFLSVTTDPFGDATGGLVFIPSGILAVTYVLAFGSFVKRVT